MFQRLEFTMSRRLLLGLLIFFLSVSAAQADTSAGRDLPPGLQIPAAAQLGAGFDPDAATTAYLELLSPHQRLLSDRYFEGGYWLQLWEVLWTVGACALLLLTGVSRWMSERAHRMSRRTWIATALYVAGFLLALFLLRLPLSIYADYLREHQYGLTQQPFGKWLGEQLAGFMIVLILGTLAVTVIYAAIRRAGSRWWLWATGFTYLFLMTLSLLAPVYIEPQFNHYKPLPPGPTRDAVLSLARANQVPTGHVEWYDASRRTTRVSANVAGFLGTTRIALNDNLLNHSSLAEIKAALGHEMGHYVLDHVWTGRILLTLVVGLAFALLHLSMERALTSWGTRLRVTDRADPAGLPLACALATLILFLLSPLRNSITRTYEAEADAFGLNAAREPYGWAMVSLRLSTYRKIHPGALEEFLFYDHPSGYDRVHGAMLWLKENQALVAAQDHDTPATVTSAAYNAGP